MNFTVMCADEPVAEIYVSDDRKTSTIKRLVSDGIKQPFSGDKFNTLRLYDFLKSRCFEDCRVDLPEILKNTGMKMNDPWEWIHVCHGVTYEDFWWIKFPDEKLRWEDVKPR